MNRALAEKSRIFRHFAPVDLGAAREDDLPVAVKEFAPTHRFFDVSAYCLQRLEVRKADQET